MATAIPTRDGHISITASNESYARITQTPPCPKELLREIPVIAFDIVTRDLSMHIDIPGMDAARWNQLVLEPYRMRIDGAERLTIERRADYTRFEVFRHGSSTCPDGHRVTVTLPSAYAVVAFET